MIYYTTFGGVWNYSQENLGITTSWTTGNTAGADDWGGGNVVHVPTPFQCTPLDAGGITKALGDLKKALEIKGGKEVYNLPNHPPCDCWLEDDLSCLIFRFAMAGYLEERIRVIGTKNQLKILVKKEKDDEFEPQGMIHRGISWKAIDVTLTIDEAFDPTKGKKTFKNGILEIRIPRAESESAVELK